MNKNNLSESKYLISRELHNALSNEKLYDKNEISKRPGIYVVVVRLLKNDDNVLVYNYLYYPHIFLQTFLVFIGLKNRSKNSIRFREWGDNLILINKDVLLNDINYKEDDLKQIDPFILNDRDFLGKLMDNLSSYFIASGTSEIIRLINKLNYFTHDDLMIDILKAAYSKNYGDLVNLILPNWYDYLKDTLDNTKEEINIINSLIFVIRDINEFVKKVSDKGFVINEGPQKWRGQINSMSAFLNSLDTDYRTSLYNHNNYHVINGLVGRKFDLDKSKFSFRNIHMNIGNVRWYSTKKKSNHEVLSKKLLDRLKIKSSFKPESEIYLFLSEFLRKSPINENTERNIENYLLNFYIQSLEEKKDKSQSLIKYDLFGSVSVKNYISEALEIIQDYLNNFRKMSFNVKGKRVSFKTKSWYHLNLILKELDNPVITEICLGILARIINGYNKPNDDCLGQNIISDLGDMIIKSYFYSLYRKFIIKNINLFIIKCKEYLDLNKDLDESVKNKILEIISNIERNHKILEVYEFKTLINKILNINGLSKINFNNIDLIIQYTLSDWKADNKELVDIYDNNLIFGIASIIIDWLKESNLIQENLVIKGKKERHTYYIPSDHLSKLLSFNKSISVRSLPLRIPMIVKPKLYSREIINGVVKERLGGYLINDEKVTDPMIIPNWELKVSSTIQDINVVYNLVNNLNSVGYKINKDMLEFINLYGDKFDLLLNYDINFDLNKSKISKREYTELESYISKLDLQENILGLAEVYSNVPEFFLPVRIDFRGRVNCVSQYLNYQSTELAKSLLLFSKGEKIMKNDTTAINYFKAFGANCFGNKLNKKSWVDRSKWIDENEKDIINYTNGKLINKADNKLLFAAFCIEYNKWLQSYNNIETSYFETHLPIQLDATCNGYQHISLLISDYDMAKELNLTKSSQEDLPKDYYGFMILKLTEYFKSKLKSNNLSAEDRNCYERLSCLIILRDWIKKALMTIPYNVSTPQKIKYIKEHFINISKDKDNWSNYDLIYQYKEDPNIILSNKEISIIASALREVLYTNFPKLKQLVLYLKVVAKIFNKLNIPIPWGSSSGLLVNQSYTSSEDIKLRPFSYDKSSFTLKVSTGRLSGNKQIRAFMPNLIHSLDAAALALLVEYLFNTNGELKNFYAIHDCFAVTANNVDMLIKNLKLVYIKIYSEDDYLDRFNEGLINSIKYYYGEDSYNPDTNEINVILDNVEIKETFPNINYVLGKELPSDLIKDSSYIIN